MGTENGPSSSIRPVIIRMLEGRVGSTLLMELLGTSQAVAFDRVYPFENSYLTYFSRLVDQGIELGPAGSPMANVVFGVGAVGPLPFAPVTINPASFVNRSLGALWASFCEELRAHNPDRSIDFYAEKYWGDATLLLKAGLTPVVIDLVRDPRDVVASIRAYNTKTGKQLFGRSNAADDSQHLRRLVAGMAFRLREMVAPMPVTKLVVHYEQLITNLAGEARRIGDALGVRLDPDSLDGARPETTRHITSASVEMSVGRWRSDLSTSEVDFIDRRLAVGMRAFGYQPSTLDQPDGAVGAR